MRVEEKLGVTTLVAENEAEEDYLRVFGTHFARMIERIVEQDPEKGHRGWENETEYIGATSDTVCCQADDLGALVSGIQYNADTHDIPADMLEAERLCYAVANRTLMVLEMLRKLVREREEKPCK